jgi:hypothetical protein
MAAYVVSRPSQARLIGLTGLALLGLSFAACGKLNVGGAGTDEMSWARAALERNSRLEVVAADPQSNTFTVRVKDTGELRMIRANEVVGGPPGGGTSSDASSPPPAAPASAQPAPLDPTVPTTTASTTSEGGSLARSAGAPGNLKPASRTIVGTADEPSSDGAAANTAPRTGLQPEPAPRAEVPDPNSDVASITPGGRTLESGPGYVIKTASKATPTARVARERSTTNSAVERRHDPIICQGDRLLQIDNRNLDFDGDAVSAEDGCEIHITNSHITARGVGISARAANVHIDNSQIEGDTASIDASKGAQVYASSSTFKGVSRRLDNSSFHDLGGNVWN